MSKSQHELLDATTAFFRWIETSEWHGDYSSFVEEFFQDLRDFGNRSLSEIEKMLSKQVLSMAREACFEEFIHRDLQQGPRAISGFISQNRQQLSAEAWDYLFGIGSSQASLYEVEEVYPNNELRLKHMLLERETIDYVTTMLKKPPEIGEFLVGRLVDVDEQILLTNGVVFLSKDFAKLFQKSLDEMVKSTQKEMKELYDGTKVPRHVAEEAILPEVAPMAVNGWLMECANLIEMADTILVEGGSEMRFVTLNYPIRGTKEDLISKLNSQKWLEPMPEIDGWACISQGKELNGNLAIEGKRLVAFAMSEEHAVRLQDRIESSVGGMLGIPSIEKVMPSEMLQVMSSEVREPETDQLDLSKLHETEVVASVLDDHYHKVLDAPIPMLGNKTPRQAIQTEDGKTLVAAWITVLESQHSENANIQHYDFGWMWKELGIEDYRRS